MKRLQRLPLSAETLSFLEGRTSRVVAASDKPAEAERLWGFSTNRAFEEIRELLAKMASGLERCMYCEDGQGCHIDHFWPKVAYPLRAFVWENYLLACAICNSNFKRDQFPLDDQGQPLLIDPTQDEPTEHLALTPQGQFIPRTPKGEHSCRVFRLDRKVLVDGRQNAWAGLEQHLIRYSELKAAGESAKSVAIKTVIRRHPFASVLVALLRAAKAAGAQLLVDRQCLNALDQCPEVFEWIRPD